MGSLSLPKAIPLVVVFVSGVFATAQCQAGYDWNKNSLGQDPCTVGSMLDASCRGLSVYTYPAITVDEQYVPPQTSHFGDLACDCNTVMYSLYMSCSLCQKGQIYSWQNWIAQCDSVYVTQYPSKIPQGTAVPHWAFYNITSLPYGTFSTAAAVSAGRDPEASPGTDTSTGSTNQRKSKIKLWIIAGAAAGGAIIFAVAAIAAFFCIRSRRRRRAQISQTQQVLIPEEELHKQRPVSTYSTPPPMPMSMPMPMPMPAPPPFVPYNPSDPSTFPPGYQSDPLMMPPQSPTDPSMFSSQNHSDASAMPPHYQAVSVTYTTPPTGNTHVTYTGAAEL